MVDYRKDLERAHRKIAKLESELHAPPPAPRAPPAPRSILAVGIGGAVALVLLGAGFAVSLRRTPAYPPPPREVTVPVEVVPPTLRLRWTSALGRVPSFANVDGVGADEIVAVLWNDARRDLPLWVVAIDTTTFRPRWSAGPFPGQEGDLATRLAVMRWQGGNVVLLTESQGGVHAIDVWTGKRGGDFVMGAPVTGMCTADDASGRVSLGRGYEEHVTLDLASGLLATKGLAKPDFKCTDTRTEPTFCNDRKLRTPCTSYAHVHGSISFAPSLSYESPDTVLTVGTATPRKDAGPLERPAPFGVVADGRSRAPRWEGTLSLPDDRVHVGGDRSHFDGVNHVIGYELVAGTFRVVARELAKGAVLWSADLEGSHEGSVLYSVRIHEGLVFVDIDSHLEIFRLADGQRVGTIRSLDIALPDGRESAGRP